MELFGLGTNENRAQGTQGDRRGKEGSPEDEEELLRSNYFNLSRKAATDYEWVGVC